MRAQPSAISEFERLTLPHHARLFRLACALCKNRDLANDLTQDALLKAFVSFAKYDRALPIFPWLAKILRHLFLDFVKSGRIQHEIAEHQMSFEAELTKIEGIDDLTHSPLSQLESAELQRRIKQEMQKLPKPQQLILVMCDMEDISYKEAAQILDIPIGTVQSRLARAREQLRQRLLATIFEQNEGHHK